MMAEANAFVSRFRVVPRRAGTLEVPSIRARLKDRTGRSRPVRVDGPAGAAGGSTSEFLGGVGRFALAGRGEAPLGPGRPGAGVSHHGHRAGGVGHDRPARAGAVRPPADRPAHRAPARRGDPRAAVADVRLQAAADPPGRGRAPAGVDRRVRPLDVALRHQRHAERPHQVRRGPRPSTPPRSRTSARPARAEAARWAALRWGPVIGLGVLLLGSAAAISWVRRRARKAGQLGGPAAARRFAARIARGLARPGSSDGEDLLPVSTWGSRAERPGPDAPAFDLALEISSALIRYLQIGIGRPPGALTPAEAGEGVVQCTGSEELGAQAARIASRCDGVLYRDAPALPEDPDRFRQDARDLFARLGGSS